MARKSKKKNRETSANGRRSNKEQVSSRAKGEVVEKVVAMMHEGSGVEVRRDVLLPAKDDASRQRQFDVLLVGNMAGYPVVIAIECKNYGRNINVKDIESFSGELEDVGLPTQQGILVSASKIGAGAQSRARSLGMRVFEIKGLTADRLSSAIHEANQQVIFVVPYLSYLSMKNMAGPGTPNHDLLIIFDEHGNLLGTLPDMVWLRWLRGEPSSVLGEHEHEFETDGWHQLVDGDLVPVWSVRVRVKVVGAVALFSGTTSQHALVRPEDGSLHRYKQQASFDIGSGQYPVEMVETEEELQKLLKRRSAALTITVGRVRAPRMRTENLYWPPSQRAVDKMRELDESYASGEGVVLTPEALRGVEEDDLTAIWEPISEEYLTIEQPKAEPENRGPERRSQMRPDLPAGPAATKTTLTNPQVDGEELYIGDAIHFFLDAKRAGGRSERTVQEYRKKLDLFQRWVAASTVDEEAVDTPYLYIGAGEVENYVVHLKERGLSDTSRKGHLAVLKSFFSTLSRRMKLPDPTDDLDEIRFHQRAPKRNYLTKREAEMLLSPIVATTRDENEASAEPEENVKAANRRLTNRALAARDHAAFSAMMYAGLRIEETAGLTPDDLSFRRGEEEVRAAKGKGNKERLVPMGPKLRKSLRRYLKVREDLVPPGETPDPHLFLNEKGKRVTENTLRRRLYKWVRQSPIKKQDIKPHDLRRTFGTFSDPGQSTIQLFRSYRSTDSRYVGRVAGTASRRSACKRTARYRRLFTGRPRLGSPVAAGRWRFAGLRPRAAALVS